MASPAPDLPPRVCVLTDDPALLDSESRRRLAAGGMDLRPLHLSRSADLDGTDVVVLRVGPETAAQCVQTVRRLRRRSGTRIVLGATAGCEAFVVQAIRAGADVFLPLPYDLEALPTTLRVLSNVPRLVETRLTRGEVSLDVAAREARIRGDVIALPPRESALLEVLMRNAGRVVTIAQLLDAVWGGAHTRTNTLAVHVSRLRRRLERDPSHPELIDSVRRVGYRYRA